MKPLTIVSVIWLVLAVFGLAIFAVWPAHAQNAGEIAHAQAGASCPHCNLFQADFSNLELKDRNFAGARLRQAERNTKRGVATLCVSGGMGMAIALENVV